MADEGPTTTGSIRAKLTLDDSDFKGKLDEAGAQAEALNGIDPKIKVTADTGDASVKMDAVALAAARLDIANQAVQLSYLRLDAIQSDDEASQISVAAAHLAASRAELSQADATDKLAAAQLAASAATDVETDSQDAQNASGGKNIQYWQLIGGAIAGVIALAAPLTAFIVGVGGGLVGMGSAGVLAIYGIDQAIKNATTTGEAYSQGLQSLKGDLDQLASTAAVGLLKDFQQVEQEVTADMPNLNSEISAFTGLLGSGASSAAQGIIQAFNVMNPLFVDGAQYVDGLAKSFDAWTSDGGLEKFVTYAEQELPVIEVALDNVAKGAIGLGTALGPLGNDLLSIVQDLGYLGQALGTVQQQEQSFFVSAEQYSKGTNLEWDSIVRGIGVGLGIIGPNIVSANSAMNSSVTAQQSASKAAADAAAKILNEANQVKFLQDAFNKINASNLTLAQAQTSLAASAQTVTTSFKTNGTTIDQSTAAGLANQQAIEGQVASAQALAQATVTATGKTQDGITSLEGSKQALENELSAQGDLTSGVQAYIDKLYDIPAVVATQVKVEYQEAVADLNLVLTKIAAVQGSAQSASASIATERAQAAASAAAANGSKAHGGTIGFASGGTYGTVSGSGSSFSDSVRNVNLSVGEEVTRMPYARQFRPALKALNAGKPQAAIAALGGHRAVSSQPASFQVQLISNGIDIIKFIDMKITDAAGNTYAAVSGGSVL